MPTILHVAHTIYLSCFLILLLSPSYRRILSASRANQAFIRAWPEKLANGSRPLAVERRLFIGSDVWWGTLQFLAHALQSMQVKEFMLLSFSVCRTCGLFGILATFAAR